METIIRPIIGFNFEYFKNDLLGNYSISSGNEWEPHITSFVKLYKSFFTIENIIDIGANFGYHTICFSQCANGHVIAFEPQQQNFELLERNVQHNNVNNVILYNFACGDENCDVTMPFIENPTTMINMGDITPNILVNEKFTVTRSIILDEFELPSKIDLIKIDVQGWEKKVLSGAHKLLCVHKPILIVEFEYFQLAKTNTSCADLFEFIRSNNYYIFYLEYKYPSDHVCVHNDHLDDFRNKFQGYIFPHMTDNNINNNIMHNITEKIVIS